MSCVVFMALSSSGRRNLAPNLSKLKWISEKRVGKASFGAKLSHYINIYLLSFERRERKSSKKTLYGFLPSVSRNIIKWSKRKLLKDLLCHYLLVRDIQ